jgi:nucleotide-binding universal stress UspA family protein
MSAAARTGPVLVAYDGRRASEHVLREAAALLAAPDRFALVVVVIKPGLASDLIELPTTQLGLPPARIDVRTAHEIEQQMYDRAQESAQRAAALLGELGLSAEGLVVAEDPEITVAETVIRIARERDAQVVVVGAHPHGPLLGATARAVVKEAPCPTLVVREPADRDSPAEAA